MHNPPHPGKLLKIPLLNRAGLSVTAAADILGVTRGAVSNLINCHTGISPEMAIRLSIALNTSSEMWLKLQTNYDLWKAEQNRNKILRQVLPIKKISGRN